MMRRSAVLLASLVGSVFAACRAAPNAAESARSRYHGRALAEWWPLRRDPSDVVAGEARTAMRALGPAAVPFLAEKAASHDMGDEIGGSSALEGMCTSAIPAMEAARARYPSPSLEAAIRRVQQNAADTAQVRRCKADVDSLRADRP